MSEPKTVSVEFDQGIAWVAMNRPDKKNAISVEMAREMVAVLDALETDERAQVSCSPARARRSRPAWTSRITSARPTTRAPVERARVYRLNAAWQWRGLLHYPKPTIAMVNGWCFGGAFTPLVACDLAIAADEATFGLSEINWGIIPAGVVCKAISTVMSQRDALYYIMTGETFDGKRAAEMRLVNESVPREKLQRPGRARWRRRSCRKIPTVLRQAKTAFRYSARMSWDEAADYLFAKSDQSTFMDPERGREEGLRQFLDEKSYKPGLGSYKRKR